MADRTKKQITVLINEAKARGDRHYFTGLPCLRGHVCGRFVIGGTCVDCTEFLRLRRYELRGDEFRAYARERHWKSNGYPEPTRPNPGKCEICGKLPKTRAMHLDHDHTTNKFRGWLCHSCNTSLGHLGDSIEGIERVLAYLRRAE